MDECLAELLVQLGDRGLVAIVNMDGERQRGRWTVLVSGKPLGGELVRWDGRRLGRRAVAGDGQASGAGSGTARLSYGLGLDEDLGWLVERLRTWSAGPWLSGSFGVGGRSWLYGWLRRLVAAQGGDPDDIHDVDLAWRAFRAFLAVPLDGLFDRWEGDVDADTLAIEFGASAWSDDQPGLLIARRFAIPAVEWHDGLPGEPSGGEDPDLDLADTVQIEMELTFPHGTTAEAEDFWTGKRSGGFDDADIAEAGELVAGLRLGRPNSSTIELTNCN